MSRKEARETAYWLRLAAKNEIVCSDEIKWELSEARQLLAMIRSAILTARSSESQRIDRSNVIAVCPLPSSLCPVRVYFLRPIFFSAFPSSSSVTSVAVVQLPIPLHNT